MTIMFQKSHNTNKKTSNDIRKLNINLKGNVKKKRNDLEFSLKFLAD